MLKLLYAATLVAAVIVFGHAWQNKHTPTSMSQVRAPVVKLMMDQASPCEVIVLKKKFSMELPSDSHKKKSPHRSIHKKKSHHKSHSHHSHHSKHRTTHHQTAAQSHAPPMTLHLTGPPNCG